MHYGSVGAGSPPNLMAELFNSMAKVRTMHVPYKGGAGSSGHMALELFRVMAGIDLIMVHYKGAGAATIDLLGGAVQISNVTIQAAVSHLGRREETFSQQRDGNRLPGPSGK